MTDWKIETVGDIVAILADPPNGRATKEQTFAQYYEDLSKPRTRGSTTENRLDNIDPFIPLEDVTASVAERGLALKGCSYYRGECVELGGRIGAITVSELFDRGWNKSIDLRRGSHGLELVRHVHSDWGTDLDTAEFHVIVGPHPDGAGCSWELPVIYTWYPGPVMGRGDSSLTEDSVVKIVTDSKRTYGDPR